MFNEIAAEGSRIWSQKALSTIPLPKPVAPWTRPAKKAPKSNNDWKMTGSEMSIEN